MGLEISREQRLQTTPSAVNYERNALGEIHYTLLENVVFSKGSLSKVNKGLAQWIGHLEYVPLSPSHGNIISIESLEYNNKMNKTLDSENDDKEVVEVEVVHDVQNLAVQITQNLMNAKRLFFLKKKQRRESDAVSLLIQILIGRKQRQKNHTPRK